jgi:hypothetical protein
MQTVGSHERPAKDQERAFAVYVIGRMNDKRIWAFSQRMTRKQPPHMDAVRYPLLQFTVLPLDSRHKESWREGDVSAAAK